MPRRYPPLTVDEVRSILKAWGFTPERTDGSHCTYSGLIKDRVRYVTVDLHYPEFDDKMIKSTISQSGLNREQFYGATKRTAAKIGLRFRR